MAVCVMNPIETRVTKVNNYALKLLGISNNELTNEDMLECLSKYIKPASIEALLFDSFNNFYVLYLTDIESTCRLVGKTIEFKSHCINVYPLLDYFLIDNVYPCVKNDELRDIFRTFGNVFTISYQHLVPNSSKFSHVLSGKREITFLLPGKESEIYIPLNVVLSPYSFHVRKFCCACLTEGHSFLYCPDIEDDADLKKIKFDVSNVKTVLKSENMNSFENYNIEDPVPDPQRAGKTLKERGESPQDMSENTIENTEKSVSIKQDEVAMEGSQEVNSEKKVEIKEDKIASQEDKSLESKITNSNHLTKVVSTATVCRFNSGSQPIARKVKTSVFRLPPLAEKLINQVCGIFVIEANVLKQLILTDGRMKSEMIKFAFSYLEDLSNLLRFLKQVNRHCHKNKKYVCLQGSFTSKVKRLQAVLCDLGKK